MYLAHVSFLPDLVDFTDEEGKGKYLPWISTRSMTTTCTYLDLKQIEVLHGTALAVGSFIDRLQRVTLTNSLYSIHRAC